MDHEFLAFAFDAYDAEGGWADFIGAFASLDEAKRAIETKCLEFNTHAREGHVVSASQREIVSEYLNGEWDERGAS